MPEDGVTEEKDQLPGDDNDGELLPHCQLYWDAFLLLNRQRIHTENGPQPIPLSEIVVARDLVFDPRGSAYKDRALYFDLILAMDSTYVELVHGLIATRREKEARKSNRGRGRG